MQLPKTIMTTLITAVIFLFTTVISTSQDKQHIDNKKENVKIEITRKTSKQEIDALTAELKEKGIDLTFSKLKYTNDRMIKKIKGQVDCNDGNSGTFKSNKFNKLIIERNYNPEADKTFRITVK